MKEFVEKLIGRLEEISVSRDNDGVINGCNMGVCEDDDCLKCLKKKVISIVNQLAEEYRQDLDKNSQGWIPCSERLPEGKESHKVLVTDEDGIMAVCYFLEVTKIFKVCWDGEEFQGVVAWQPLPDPYIPAE